MTFESFRISVLPESDSNILDDVWVRLEQVVPPKLSYYASVKDIYKMWNAAATGKSAQTMRPVGCPVEFDGTDIRVYLGFYAWPSSPDLQYSLSAAIGTIGPEQVIRKQREFSLFVANSDRIDLPYYMENLQIEWETPTYGRYGDEIPNPGITNNGNWLAFSASVFGAIRVVGDAVGGYYCSEIVMSKPLTEEEISAEEIQEQIEEELADGRVMISPRPTTRLNGYKIENLENTITASWVDTDGKTDTDQLRLEIPPCVEDALAFCPDMYKTIVLLCQEISTRQVYYSTCDEDTIIAIWDGVDPISYCRDITGQKASVSPWGDWLI